MTQGKVENLIKADKFDSPTNSPSAQKFPQQNVKIRTQSQAFSP